MVKKASLACVFCTQRGCSEMDLELRALLDPLSYIRILKNRLAGDGVSL